MTRDELIAYCENDYNMEADHPFKHYPDYVALRHLNGKWFSLMMNVPADKLGLPGTADVEIADFKVEPELNSIL